MEEHHLEGSLEYVKMIKSDRERGWAVNWLPPGYQLPCFPVSDGRLECATLPMRTRGLLIFESWNKKNFCSALFFLYIWDGQDISSWWEDWIRYHEISACEKSIDGCKEDSFISKLGWFSLHQGDDYAQKTHDMRNQFMMSHMSSLSSFRKSVRHACRVWWKEKGWVRVSYTRG